jgi:hypothetical protein
MIRASGGIVEAVQGILSCYSYLLMIVRLGYVTPNGI